MNDEKIDDNLKDKKQPSQSAEEFLIQTVLLIPIMLCCSYILASLREDFWKDDWALLLCFIFSNFVAWFIASFTVARHRKHR